MSIIKIKKDLVECIQLCYVSIKRIVDKHLFFVSEKLIFKKIQRWNNYIC